MTKRQACGGTLTYFTHSTDRNFGTDRFIPLFPKAVLKGFSHKRV